MIRIAQPQIGPEEEAAVLAVLRSGRLAQGPAVAEFERAFAEYVGARHAVAVSSGTGALYVALRAHGIGPGDEAIVPTFTFAATANAVLLAGATPVLIDITNGHFGVDPALVAAAITPRTRAVLPVHLFGQPCDLDALRGVADAQDVLLIEDACQALGASWQGSKVGNTGTACFSFYATKSITTGEGGMIATDDDAIAAAARTLRNQGEHVRYRTELLSGNVRMTELAAALGSAQLPKLDGWNERRRANAAWLNEHLAGVMPPAERPGAGHVYQQYTIRVPGGARDRLLEALRAEDIEAIPYYERCVHQQPLYVERGIGGSFPVAERAAGEVLSLPVHPGLSRDDLERIAAVVNLTMAPVEARRA